MPRFSMTGLEPVLAEMQKLGEMSGPTAQKMLMAGAEAVRQAWRDSAEEHGHRDTGAMIDSINYARAPKDVSGALSIDISPQGVDGHGVRNAEKAFILNYGTSKIPGSGWVFDTDKKCETTVVPAMEAVWDAYIGGDGGGGNGITTTRS